MSQIPYQPRPMQVKPQPDVYTVLTLVAALALAVTIGVSLYHLLAGTDVGGCGLSLTDLFGKVELPGAGR